MYRLLDYWPSIFTAQEHRLAQPPEDEDEIVAQRAEQVEAKYKNEQWTRVVSLDGSVVAEFNKWIILSDLQAAMS